MKAPLICSFDDLVKRLPKSPQPPSGPTLSLAKLPIPFVPQTAIIDRAPQNASPLDSDVLLFTAPAAVGKSTFARALSAKSAVALLDLANVPVATQSLRGVVAAEAGSNGPKNLQHGAACVIVDALDEGRLCRVTAILRSSCAPHSTSSWRTKP